MFLFDALPIADVGTLSLTDELIEIGGGVGHSPEVFDAIR